MGGDGELDRGQWPLHDLITQKACRFHAVRLTGMRFHLCRTNSPLVLIQDTLTSSPAILRRIGIRLIRGKTSRKNAINFIDHALISSVQTFEQGFFY